MLTMLKFSKERVLRKIPPRYTTNACSKKFCHLGLISQVRTFSLYEPRIVTCSVDFIWGEIAKLLHRRTSEMRNFAAQNELIRVKLPQKKATQPL